MSPQFEITHQRYHTHYTVGGKCIYTQFILSDAPIHNQKDLICLLMVYTKAE